MLQKNDSRYLLDIITSKWKTVIFFIESFSLNEIQIYWKIDAWKLPLEERNSYSLGEGGGKRFKEKSEVNA